MPSLFPEPVSATKSSTTSWVNAHCDGGARGNPGPAGFGAVLADDAGHTLAELSEYLGHKTNNFAEYSGLLACLQWALENGAKNLRVTSDSELMVKQIQGKYKVNSPDLRPLWEEARRRIARLDRFEITHALRHKNKAADALANQAMDRGSGRPAAGRPGAAASSNTGGARAVVSTAAGAEERVGGRSAPEAKPPTMLRGFTRDGAVHLLGSATLPDGIFVKVIPE
jgi:probable phosphoglycerate mutase